MTISLAIDTATSRTIVAMVDDGNVLFENFHEGAMDHGKAISELVSQALKVCPVPNQVVVGMGPGPFTGLRVGITFAHTFSLARSIPVSGVCSLDAIVIDQAEYTVAIDARRKAEVEGFILDQYSDMKKLVELSNTQNISEPMYLRRPDAVPTAERT